MIGLSSFLSRQAKRILRQRGLYIVRVGTEDQRNLNSPYQLDSPAVEGADAFLLPGNPQLLDLKARYQAATPAAGRGTRWSLKTVSEHVNLRYFRGDGPYIWHYRELPETTRLKYFIRLQEARQHDPRDLLNQLGEDGAFGCWTFQFPDAPVISRDLLDSISELYFLEQELKLLSTPGRRVLDIGAGCGRMAYRYLTAQPEAGRYTCVDAIPESTFLCDYYLQFRQIRDKVDIVALDRIETELVPGNYDVAFNIHSFSECPRHTIAWWLSLLQRLEVPRLFIVPNDGVRLLSLEADGQRLDFADLVAQAGFREIAQKPVIADPAARELTGIHDCYLLFARDA